jgi:hypothetical protein
MSNVTYKCDTCKRSIELLENKKGLTVFSKCTITSGCRGNLYKLSRNPDGIRENFLDANNTLVDFTPRKAFYKFNQDIISNKWVINHNMGTNPAVIVYEDIGNGVLIELDNDSYDIIITSINSLELSFDSFKKGSVHLISRSSVSTLPNTNPSENELNRVTINGVFTMAIPKIYYKQSTDEYIDLKNEDISIEVCIEIPDKEPIFCFETIPNEIVGSSWYSWDEILVRRRRNYYIRTKNILDFKVFEDARLTLSDIENGTKISFKRINLGDGVLRELESRYLLLLLTNEPYAVVDKNVKEFIDAGELNSENINYLVFQNNDFYADINAIERTYPDIIKKK